MDMVQVEVLRRYPRDGLIYEPGSVIVIPDYAVPDATRGRTPHVLVIGPAPIEIDADFDATENAIDLARAIPGMDLAKYAGKGSGEKGRIHKPDVERWAEEEGLISSEG